MAEGRIIHMGRFPFTLDRDYVMFDLEGIPSQVDEVEKIYMWGMQVFGPSTGDYRPALAALGPGGDATGWRRFLVEANDIFQAHGDIPFVHWAVYEKTMINKYINRFGDHGGVAQRVLDNLVDLLPITQDAVVLPDPSYSLKVVELRAGFHRGMEEYGGSWSIAQYIRAVEASDEAVYSEMMDAILQYNREDLEATWAVFAWLANNFGHEPNAAA
jgi:predicted RecB family nuclease